MAAGLAGVALWVAPAAQAPPQLKTRVDLVTIDVTVLDRNRRPVTGLSAGDFILLEDGKPQAVAAFDEISVEASEPATAAWLKSPPVDVAANRHDESRLFVLVIDDATLPMDPYMVRRAKEMATAFIEGLGPTDLAAVVFTRDNRNAQDFTRDRARLIAAANRLSGGFVGGAVPSDRAGLRPGAAAPVVMDSKYYLSSLNTLGRVAEYLEAVPMRRKIVAYLSIGVPVSSSDAAQVTSAGGGSLIEGEIQQALVASLRRTIDRAQRANVAIYGLDPAGLDGLEVWNRRGLVPDPGLFTQSLLTLANATGGHAFVNTNDFKPGIATLFEETKSYYLLAYAPAPPPQPGDYRRVEVKVRKPGLDVVSRKGFFASRQGEPSAEPLSGGIKAISGVLPDPDLPLRGIAAPLLQADGTTAVAITLALDPAALKATVGDALEIFTHLFDPEGRPRGDFEQKARLCASPGWCELTSLIAAKPGRHAVRIGVKHVPSGRTGSVYLDVEVPDFAKRALTVSGLMVEATPPLARATDDRVRALIPIVPTTRREFAATDKATLLFRVHQRPDRTAKEVTRTLRVINARDEEVVSLTETIPASSFAKGAAEQRLTLPLEKLAPGRYLVAVTVAATGGEALERQLSFTVRSSVSGGN